MTKIDIEIHDDLISVIDKLKNINDTGIELVVPEGAVLFENVINIKMLKNWADKESRVITFVTDDVYGQNLIFSLEEDDSSSMLDVDEATDDAVEPRSSKKIIIPKIKLPKLSFKKGGLVYFGVGILLVGTGLFFGYRHLSTAPQAYIRVVVNSQPLTKSLEIKVKSGATTNVENKVLAGETLEVLVEEKLSAPTTGEKIVGEKATGTITIFNKTDTEKKFKKGTDIIYEDDKDKEYIYEITKDVTVPPREEQAPDPEDPDTITYIKGKADVEVEASVVGEKYNLDAGETLSVEDQKTTAFDAEIKEDIEGGKEEKIKVVAQKDIDDLKAKILENAKEKAIRALESAVAGDKKKISGSESVIATKESLSHVLDAETEELTLEQTYSAKGLLYKPSELDAAIDKMVVDLVPENYVLSTKERVLNVEVLGNTDSTVLSDSEADLQVTLKTYVVSDISEDTVKDAVLGKNVAEAQKYVGGIRNIKTYEFSIKPRYPFFDSVPKDKSRINIVIERE